MKEFNEIVDEAIAFTSRKSVANITRADSMGLINYLKEFRTVRIDLGRCAGKTQYVREHAKLGDVIIVPTLGMMSSCYQDIGRTATDAKIFPVIDLERARGLHPDRIFIDEGRMIDEALRHQPLGLQSNLYRLFGRSTDQMFIIFA